MAHHVHRIARSDVNDTVLLNVTITNTKTLDLDIEGTEGENPYFASFKHTKLTKALCEDSNISASSWPTVLRCLLLHTRPSTPADRDLLSPIELIASITSTTNPPSLVLTIRKNIEGIHQRLAELVLPLADDRELDTLAWVGTATERGEQLEAEVRRIQKDYAEQGEMVRMLEEKLEQLAEAKKAGEEELLGKFAVVLNGKKGKVRDLLRVLGASRVDGVRAAAVAKSRGHAKGTAKTAGPSRPRKRKPATTAPSSDTDEDGFESMKGAHARKAGADGQTTAQPEDGLETEDEQDRATTASEHSDMETTDDGGASDDDDEGPPAVTRNTDTESNGQSMQTAKPMSGASAMGEREKTPPRRELPFGRGNGNRKGKEKEVEAEEKQQEPEKMVVDEDAETEDETDDEL